MTIELQFSQLLWHTRGKYWDYEFICLPKDISEHAYSLMESVVRSYSSREYPVYFTGTVNRQRFIGVLKYDTHLRDHASRAVQHLAIWFLPDGLTSAWSKIPAGWFDQFYDSAQEIFQSERIYGLPEDQKEELYRADIPLGRFLREQIYKKIGAISVPIRDGAPPSSWNDMGEVSVKKKIESSPHKTNRVPPVVIMAITAIGVIAISAWFLWRK